MFDMGKPDKGEMYENESYEQQNFEQFFYANHENVLTAIEEHMSG